MPFVAIVIDDKISSHQANELRDKLVGLLAELTGKSPKWFMTSTILADVKLNGQPAAFVDFRYLGDIPKESREKIAEMVASLFEEEVDIPSGQVYMTFCEMERDKWAWNGSLFG